MDNERIQWKSSLDSLSLTRVFPVLLFAKNEKILHLK